MVKLGMIGGSGLDNPEMLSDYEEVEISTPYGEPSSKIVSGKIGGIQVAFISRHGRQHTIPPSTVNYRANIWALKKIGVTHILATTAVGSLKEEIKRGDIVVLDQFIDFTRKRLTTFHDSFEPQKPVHTPMSEPFSKELRNHIIKAVKGLGYSFHDKGCVVTIEGPRFSTRAESNMFRLLGADVINMSVASEAILANEAGIPYAGIAMSTDYDCWKTDEEPVTWSEILKVFEANVSKVKKIILEVVKVVGSG